MEDFSYKFMFNCITVKFPGISELIFKSPRIFLLQLDKTVDLQMKITHWGWVTHICVRNLTIIGSDNGLLPDRRQAIIWTNAGILSIGPLGTNFSEILIEIHTFSFKKMPFKMLSGKWRPFCLRLKVFSDLTRMRGWQDISTNNSW